MYSVWNTDYLEYTIIIFILGSISLFTGLICFFMFMLCIGFYHEKDRRDLVRLLQASTV